MYKPKIRKLEKEYVEKLIEIRRKKLYDGLDDDEARDKMDVCICQFLREHGYDNLAKTFEDMLFS